MTVDPPDVAAVRRPRIFVSYARQDIEAIDTVVQMMQRTGAVWIDSELVGGAAWWQTILEQIRACDVFCFAVSDWSLASKPCQAELCYAQALQRPVVPVQIGPVDSLRVTRFAATQIIDFRNPHDAAVDALTNAVQRQSGRTVPLPTALPAEPPVPFAYLMRLATTLDDQELTRVEQAALVSEMRSRLDEDGNDPTVRHDIMRLLRMLHDRPDVTWRTRTEIDTMFSADELSAMTPAGGLYLAPVQAPLQSPVRLREHDPDSAVTTPIATAAGRPVRAQPMRVDATAREPDAGRRTRRRTLRWLLAGGAVALSATGIVVAAALVHPREPATPIALLDDTDLNAVMGTSAMRATESSSTKAKHTRGVIDVTPAECAGPLYPGLDRTYLDSGTRQLTWRASEDGGGLSRAGVDGNHFVDQNVAVFGDAERALAFVRDSARRWSDCNATTSTVTYFGRDRYTWTIGEQAGEPPKITQMFAASAGEPGYTCQRVLSAVDAMVIDIKACGPHVVDEANWVADRLAARLVGVSSTF